MQQYTSEEALNAILNIINTVVGQYEEKQSKKQNSSETGDLVTALMTGVAAGASKDVNIGSQIESLANGMSMLKDKGIKEDDAKTVAGMISTLGTAIEKLNFSQANLDAVQAVAQALVMMGSIDDDIVRRISNLHNIDFSVAEQISRFIDTLGNIDSDIKVAVRILKDLADVDDKIIKNINNLSSIDSGIATQLKMLFDSFNNMDINEQSVQDVVNVLNTFKSIDNKTLNAIKALGEIDFSVAEQISRFIDTLGNISTESIENISNLSSIDKQIANDVIGFLKEFDTDINVENIKNSLEAIVVLGQIDKDTIKNIEKLDKINFGGIDKLKEFISKLNFSVSGEVDEKQLRQDIKTISELLKSVSSIVDGESFKFSTLFAPSRGKLMGKAIANFFEELIKAVPEKEIKMDIKGIADIMNVFLPFAKEDSQYSIKRLKRVMNAKNGGDMGAFFRELLEQIPDEKDVSKTIRSISELMKVLCDFGYKDYVKMKKIFTKKNGEQFGQFFFELAVGLENLDHKNLKGISDFLKDLTSIGVVGALTLKLLKGTIDEKFGKALNGFATSLMKGLDKEKIDSIKAFTESIKLLSQGMMLLTGTMLAMAAGIAILGADVVMGAIVLTMGFTAGILFILKKMTDRDKDVKDGTDSLMNVAKAITILTADVILLAGVAYLMESIAWESIGKVGVIFGAVLVAMWVTQIISDKWKDGGESALNAMKGISLLMLAAVATIGLAAMISENFLHDDIEYGMLMVGIVVVAAIGLVWLLKKIADKDMEEAVNTLWNIVGIIAVTALVIGFLIAPLADRMVEATLGLIVVGVTILGMIGAVKLLSMIEDKEMKNAVNALVVLTGCLAVVSLVAAFILPMIGAQMGDVLIGAGVVLVIIGVMELMTWALSKIDKEVLDSTNMTLAVLTVCLLAVSLVAAFILPQVAERWDDALIGGVVVLAIIGLMVGLVWLMSKIDEESLKQTYIALGVLTVCLLAISLIALFILPEIGEKFKESGLGAVVVLGIVAVMVALVWWLSKIDDDNLKWGMIAVVGIALVILGISLITKELLIPIGEHWEDAYLGAGCVILLVGLMSLIVGTIGKKLDSKQIIKGVLAIAAIGGLLFELAYIINEYIVPIGKNGEEAVVGSAVIVGLVGSIALIIWGLSKISAGDLAKGGIAVAGIGAILWSLGEMLPSYIELCLMMEKDAKKIAIGGLEVAATLGVWGILMLAVGYLMSFGASFLAMGAAAIAGIALVLYGIGEMLPSYIELCLMMEKDAKKIAIGGLEVVATLGVWGLVMTGIGALMAIGGAAFLAAGAAAISGIAGVLWVISQALPDYFELCKNAYENKKYVDKGTDVVLEILTKFGLIMEGIGLLSMNPFISIGLGAGAAVLIGITEVIDAIAKSLDPFLDVLNKIKDYKITSTTIGNFTKLFIGSGISDEDPKSLYGSIKKICDAMNEIGLYSSKMAGVIAKNLTPIFKTLSMFIDVVGRISSMKYVDSWNADGTPASYSTISPQQFRSAGMAISESFGTFLTELGMGLDKLKDVSMETIIKLSVAIKPVTDAVSQFSDTILAVLSSKIECEWDKDGKPIKYRKFDATEFASAAATISENFASFLDILSTKLEPISEKAGVVLNQLKDGIQPVISAACALTDSIMGILKGSDYTVMEDGKEVKKHLEITKEAFQEAGSMIGNGFVDFITLIYDSFKMFDKEVEVDVSYTTTEGNSYVFGLVDTKKQVTKFKKEKQTVNIVGKLLANMVSVQEIVAAAADFVEVVAKTSEYLQKYDMKANATLLGDIFVTFVETLGTKFGHESWEPLIKQTMTNLEQAQKLISNFSNAYSPLVKLVEDYKDKHVKNDDIDILCGALQHLSSSETLDKLSNIKNLDVEAMKKAVNYSKEMRNVAEQLSKLAEELNNADITDACLKFIKDIEILTQPELSKKVSASRRALRQFAGDLVTFTKQVVSTRKDVIKFTNSMKKATDSLRTFDDVLIKREKQRNEAIQHMAELIERTGNAITSMSSAIEHLDQNAILRNFQSIAEMLELAKSAGEEAAHENNNQQHQNNSSNGSNQQNRQGNGGNTTVVHNGNQNAGKQMITVHFSGTPPMVGWVERTNL